MRWDIPHGVSPGFTAARRVPWVPPGTRGTCRLRGFWAPAVEPFGSLCYDSRHAVSESSIVVNADGPETRVALIEKGILSELYVERDRERGTVGNKRGFSENMIISIPAAYFRRFQGKDKVFGWGQEPGKGQKQG